MPFQKCWILCNAGSIVALCGNCLWRTDIISINKAIEILTFSSFPQEVIVSCEIVRKRLSKICELKGGAVSGGGGGGI